MSEERDTQIPACQKCKLRKVRCNRQAPKCGNCTKANIACIIVDHITGQSYSRQYIAGLEDRERELRERVHQSGPVGERSSVTESSSAQVRSDAAESTPVDHPTGGTATSHNGFVGDGSGLGFLHIILSDSRWLHHRARILHQLANRPRITRPQHTSNSLPPMDEAQELIDNYLVRFHKSHAFLLRKDILDIFSRVYAPSTPSSMPPHSIASAQDYFRIFMIFAVSSTTRYRLGISAEHPYGYFLAAKKYLSEVPLIKDIDGIQNLLLVTRFGMYYHIGTSIWELSYLCMRQCIEWRLHVPSDQVVDAMQEQHHRRIFWECYALDRYSSGILGRPFAIRESEATVPLPVDVDDATIINSRPASLSTIQNASSSHPTELSCFVFHVKLRRISSRIHSTFYRGRAPHTKPGNEGVKATEFKTIGHIYTAFSDFHRELEAWRRTAPVFLVPRTLYEYTEWNDFLYEKDRLLLARGAMHNVSSRPYSVGGVTKEILTACYVSATRVICLYADLMGKGIITWTRSYFQVIFTAGLTVIYCLSLEVLKGPTEPEVSQRDPLETLMTCSKVLAFFKEKMPDAGPFAVVFDALKDECTKDRSVDLPLTTSSEVNEGEQLHARSHSQAFDHGDIHPNQFTFAPPSNVGPYENPLVNTGNSTNVDHFNFQETSEMLPYNEHSDQSMNLGLTGDMMQHLEAGMEDYAWGSINMDLSFWDQMSFE
ncbi:hypothetical protein BU24DRAFT_403287 [Aaosphaeria arxii CBS 175.79]|uniref:Zn(2)-C6 fungal-type domain-containing protein n=1 Tax=Aaosphaeria arxii CBS 175.79 TaxID=1450172 RepID=A0A6A5X627_9PLEO|nr:uncharacterized protein BU24DRAFT_403287 [Aaosphaeria arxii CBS 175.79]KAF2008399.1 hypothetical protein BU24DRAFT_403287 [Aaosphaeria arxii CBS 175.79]